MKKILITISCFLIIIFSQKNVHAQLIDGITFIPANAQFTTSSSKNATLFNIESSWGLSVHPQLLFQKEVSADIDFFSGLGYEYSLEVVNIRENINSFSKSTGVIWQNTPPEDTSLQINSATYSNNYLTIPIGIRFYSSPKDKKGIKFTLSSKIDFAILTNSKTSVKVNTFTNSGLLGLPIAQQVYGTIYEKDAASFFKEKNKNFAMNLQIGLGY
ncbi:MAG TPA: hypothetical protein ENJ53_07795, partial [Phaeodactylibacter sp.]|nr:hypothetical protein [Phaeodactylibacter sp.]